MVDTKEIQLRIDTLKATAFTDGVESTEGLWMVLQENAKAKKNFNNAIPSRATRNIRGRHGTTIWRAMEGEG